MRGLPLRGFTAALAFASVAFSVTPAFADDKEYTARIQEAQQQIDQVAASSSDEAHIDALVKEFGVDAAQVREMREAYRDKGWGAIAVLIAAGKEIQRVQPDTVGQNQIRQWRDAGKSWEEVAELTGKDFRIENILEPVNRVREDFRSHAANAEHTGSSGSAADENKERQAEELRAAQQAIDGVAAKSGDEHHYRSLTETFGVERSTVESLREAYRDKGWGEITVQLAMAKQLAEMNPSAFSSTTEALAKIRRLRDEGGRWDQIARSIDPTFRLEPVLRSVNEVKGDFQSV